MNQNGARGRAANPGRGSPGRGGPTVRGGPGRGNVGAGSRRAHAPPLPDPMMYSGTRFYADESTTNVLLLNVLIHC